MKELGEQLIDVHSQHQNLLLNKEGFQLNVLDILAHDEEELNIIQRRRKDSFIPSLVPGMTTISVGRCL